MSKGRTPPPANDPALDPIRMTPDQQQRSLHHLHRVQAGVALNQERDPSNAAPKHLRVGIDSAHVSHAALVWLLVAKGVITNDEYVEALLVAAKAEADRYEAELQKHYGPGLKLGSLY